MSRGGGLHNIMESSLPRAGDTTLVELNDRELRLVVSGLKRMRYAITLDMAKQKQAGWKPEPGKRDNNKIRMDTLRALMERLRLLNPNV